MKSDSILFLTPVFKEMIWGGSRLKTDFGYNIPSDKTGECWAISAHSHGDCTVSAGKFKGMKLSELWNSQKELFGNLQGDKFPLLIKIIDAHDDLSIQVHPDDAYAAEHEQGSLGKMECWYILDCKEDGDIVIGHHAKDKVELRSMVEGKQWNQLIRTIPVHKGDFLQIDPGTVHAIKAGTVILETQQNSDITYRVYDYDRLTDGKPRDLHVQKSIDVITAPFTDDVQNKSMVIEGTSNIEGTGNIKELIRCKYYKVFKIKATGSFTGSMKEPFMNMSVIEGTGDIDGVPIQKGSHFILPNGYGEYCIKGEVTLISSCI